MDKIIMGLISLKKYKHEGDNNRRVNRDEPFKLLPVMAVGSHKSPMQWTSMGHFSLSTCRWRKKIHDQFFFNKNNKL